jgi:hypothetical protein
MATAIIIGEPNPESENTAEPTYQQRLLHHGTFPTLLDNAGMLLLSLLTLME